tara:strand:+ start:32489 stop:33004 length:516 start_codon:yes stop_codon:yes gene_type:complete
MRFVLIIILSLFAVTACKGGQSTSQKQEQTRTEVLNRADAAVPTPVISNFIARKTVAEYMRRMDQPNKLFYIYIVADTGNIIGYYVSRGKPVSSCLNMTPPDRGDYYRNGGVINRVAPSLNGLYNAGGGACNSTYFFDAETDALVEISGLNLFTADQPLNLDAEPITVVSE